MHLRHWLFALFLLLVAGTATAQTFPKLSGRVVDAASQLSPEQEAQLTQLSEQVEKASGRQLVVATIPDLQGYTIEDYGYQLGRAWKIGQKDANNGIVLIVAPNERKVRIEVGYGLEPLMTDAMSGMIIDTIILPRFRAHDVPGGILAGAQEIAEQMKLPLESAEIRAKARLDQARQAQKSHARSDGGGTDWFMTVFWIAVIFFFIVPAILGSRRGGRRYRRGGAPVILWGPGWGGGWGSGGGSSWGGGSGGGSSWGGGGGGGFSGGGGSFGGGGASGSW